MLSNQSIRYFGVGLVVVMVIYGLQRDSGQVPKPVTPIPTPTIIQVPTATSTPPPSPQVQKLEKYFAYRRRLNGRLSPLASHSALLVDEAEKYGLDYRLVATIATIESNQCHATPDRDPYNCWGWGIYPGSVKEPFTDYVDGIKVVTRGLARQYHRRGYDTIEEIAQIYNPNTPEAWGAKVLKIFKLIEEEGY